MQNKENLEPLSIDNRLFLLKTRGDYFTLKVKGEDASIKALHSLYDPLREAEGLVDRFQFQGTGILVVLGLGLGYHLIEITRRYPEAMIIVVEALPAIYEAARKHGPFNEISDRVRCFCGRPQKDVIREISRLQIQAGMAPLSVFSLPSAVSAFHQYYEPILSTLKKSESARLWERLKYSKFREKTAKVVLIDFNYFLTREIDNAIQGLGHRVIRFPVKKSERGEGIVSRLIEKILEFRPDFLLTLNHLGFDEEGVLTSFLKSIEMPVASWYVDSPNLIVKAFSGNVSPYTALFLWDNSYMADMKEIGFETVGVLPLATDEKIFQPMNVTRETYRKYACEVGFVGNSMVKAVDERLGKVSKHHHPLVKRLADAMLNEREPFDLFLSARPLKERTVVQRLSRQERIDFEAAVLWQVTQLYRLSCVEKLGEFNTRVHGDRGWHRILKQQDIRIFSSLDYYRELPLFYNVCRVNLNATSLQMAEAVNQRVFDIPACGGFLLTDTQQALGDLFEIGKEMITYRDKREIPDLIRYYLHHPSERESVCKRGRERVLKEHTYKHRLSTLIQRMKRRYGK